MALHTDLDIYKSAYELMRLLPEITKEFPREFKQLMGHKIRDECVEMSTLILRANIAFGDAKVPHITELLERVDMVNQLFRLSHDLKWVSHGLYARAIKITTSIGKQAGGWKKKFANTPVA